MATMIDLRDLAWKDNENGYMNRITDFATYDDVNVVWFMDIESLDEHCMDIDLFVEKFTACGLFDDLEQA
jgi:hypothetical protein